MSVVGTDKHFEMNAVFDSTTNLGASEHPWLDSVRIGNNMVFKFGQIVFGLKDGIFGDECMQRQIVMTIHGVHQALDSLDAPCHMTDHHLNNGHIVECEQNDF